eukprot:COSAG06_NODE_1281_length_10018_cov_15.949894_6_plen_73_part_00
MLLAVPQATAFDAAAAGVVEGVSSKTCTGVAVAVVLCAARRVRPSNSDDIIIVLRCIRKFTYSTCVMLYLVY